MGGYGVVEGRTLSWHDLRMFEVTLLMKYILHFFFLVPPPPLYLDDLKCHIHVLMMFFYQPCLG